MLDHADASSLVTATTVLGNAAAPLLSAIVANNAVASLTSAAVVLDSATAPPTSGSAVLDNADALSTLTAVVLDNAAISSTSAAVVQDNTDNPSSSAASSSGISLNRKRAKDGLIQQAQRMIKRSRIEHVAGNPGDNVTVSIPVVDRGRGDPRNIMGVILERDANDLYRIAVKGGILSSKYARNQFDLCSEKLLSVENMSLDKEIGLRAAVQFESICGGQGFVKCGCSGNKRCSTNKCKCYRAKVKCNSRCHACLICCNKN